MTKPNIIYIYADDLGRGMLSCYGQQHFHTPNIDRLAGEGMRFTQAYGVPFCAPARASLLTGMHDAHAGRWTFNRAGLYIQISEGTLTLPDVYEVIHNTGIQPGSRDVFLGNVAKQAGYVTGQIGKLEWGFATTDAEIRRHGWDYHYGYYDHQRCHGFYPPFLFENGDMVPIRGNTRADCGKGSVGGVYETDAVEHDPAGRAVYSQDLFDQKILDFIRTHRNEPFFLYHPSQLPHGPTYYPDHFPEVASNPELTPVEREYASMVLRLDRTVGIILDELDHLGLSERTLVLFASDNGHQPYYRYPERCRIDRDLDGNLLDQITRRFTTATCGDVFDGNDGLSGLKVTNWEGGVRIPFLARWPGVVPEGVVSGHFFANYDSLATVADLVGAKLPESSDGISFLPALQGREDAPQHNQIVYASHYGPSLVTRDGWKLRTYLHRDRILDFGNFGAPIHAIDGAVIYQLYYLPDDIQEQNDLADAYPEKVNALRGLLLKACDGNLAFGTPQAHFAFYNL